MSFGEKNLKINAHADSSDLKMLMLKISSSRHFADAVLVEELCSESCLCLTENMIRSNASSCDLMEHSVLRKESTTLLRVPSPDEVASRLTSAKASSIVFRKLENQA